jgi:hypothetical protein
MQTHTKSSVIHFIGDSHARNMAYYVIRMLTSAPIEFGKIHSGKRVGKITFHWGHYIVDTFIPALRRVMSIPQVLSGREPVVMGVGAWGVSLRNITYFAKVAVPAFRKEMLILSRSGAFTKSKVIFFSAPPVPLGGVEKTRNPMVGAAANRRVADVISEVGNITYVDYFGLTRIFINESVYKDAHYLVVNATGTYGHVGMALADYVIHLVCTQLKIT